MRRVGLGWDWPRVSKGARVVLTLNPWIWTGRCVPDGGTEPEVRVEAAVRHGVVAVVGGEGWEVVGGRASSNHGVPWVQ